MNNCNKYLLLLHFIVAKSKHWSNQQMLDQIFLYKKFLFNHSSRQDKVAYKPLHNGLPIQHVQRSYLTVEQLTFAELITTLMVKGPILAVYCVQQSHTVTFHFSKYFKSYTFLPKFLNIPSFFNIFCFSSGKSPCIRLLSIIGYK